MVAIVDYHAGNIGSIKNMLDRLGYSAVITNRHDEIENSNHIILPGVGSFDYGMSKLHELNLLQILRDKVFEKKTPVLGICLGAQLMLESSEEGLLRGLSWIEGTVKRFPNYWGTRRINVPNMGWDNVVAETHNKLFTDLASPRFYFAHAYYISCSNHDDVVSHNNHGVTFDSSFAKENITGVQFHPEKSHSFGKKLLSNFIEKY